MPVFFIWGVFSQCLRNADALFSPGFNFLPQKKKNIKS